MEEVNEIIDDNLTEERIIRRRDLLPWSIKIFLWIFWLLSSFLPIGIVMSFLDINTDFALYGLETSYLFNPMGITLTLIFTLKWMVCFGLWTEKNWGARLAMLDAIVGLIMCAWVMLVYPLFYESSGINFRIEIFLLIPYLWWSIKISSEWKHRKRVL